MSRRSPPWAHGKVVACDSINGGLFRTGWRPPPQRGADRAAKRAEAERATAEFLAQGGTITKVTAEPAPLPEGADPSAPWGEQDG